MVVLIYILKKPVYLELKAGNTSLAKSGLLAIGFTYLLLSRTRLSILRITNRKRVMLKFAGVPIDAPPSRTPD